MLKMKCCFIVILLVSLSLSHIVYGQTVITVDGKDGNDTMCDDGSHPCKTLDVALNAVKNSNITIKISNGIYHHNSILSSTITYSDISITGSGINVTVIECSNGTGFGFINASDISISELTMSGCGELRTSTTLNAASTATLQFRAALYFLNVVNVIIDNVAVINSNGMGVTMYDITGAVNVQNSIFRNNNVPLNELEKYPGGGGFSVEFTFCKPGLVQLLHTSECETSTNINSLYLFHKCTFQSNYATTVNESSTTYIPNAYGFRNQQFGRGGGLSVFFKGKALNNSVTINTCKFIDNHAVWGGGFHSDIVDHSKNNTLNIIHCVFNSNWCPSNDGAQDGLVSFKTGGGAIRIALLFFNMQATVEYNSIEIQNCTFTNNSAYYGGAVSYKITKEPNQITASNTLTFARCSWHSNKAQTGSAVNLVSQPFPVGVTPYVRFSDCMFSHNMNRYSDNSTKPVGTGALYSDNIPVEFSGKCNFSSNEGTALAGATTYFMLVNDSLTLFSNNSGNNGGAIALLGNTYLILEKNTTLWFTDNKAYSKGGAIYFISSSERDFISTQKCFIFYSDRNAEQGNWNVSVNFQNNTDSSDKSIYATTLLPCVWENLPGNVEVKSSSVDVLFNQTFHFINSLGPTVGNNSVIDPISITINESVPVRIPPGKLYKFNITSFDELGNEVKPVFLV